MFYVPVYTSSLCKPGLYLALEIRRVLLKTSTKIRSPMFANETALKHVA